MSKSKLHQILEHFSKVELNRLEKFVASPYFNSSDVVLNILRELIDCVRKDTFLSDEELMSKADPGETDVLRFRKKMSLLVKLIQDFLAQEKLEEQPMHKANYLLEALREKKIPILLPSSIRLADRLADRQYFQNSDNHLQTFRLLKNKYELSELELTRDKKGVLERFDPKSIDQSLDEFYFVEKLRLMTLILNWSNVYQHEYALTFFDEIEDYIRSNPSRSIAVDMYHSIYLTYIEPDEDQHYSRLFRMIQEHIESFPNREANNILEAAINYCIRRLNKGSQQYLEESLKLYKEGIRTELLFRNGRLSPVTFRNVCTSGIRLGEYAWVENFIESHQHRLPQRSRDSLVHLTMAQLYFYQKRFEEVLPLLQNYESQDPNLNLSSRSLYCAALYELDYLELLDYQLDSFKAILYRSKAVSDLYKRPYKAFVKYLQKLLTRSNNKDELEKLYGDIKKKRDSYNTSWLLEKIEEIVELK